MAPFAAQYADCLGDATKPKTEAVLTMFPPSFLSIRGMIVRQHKYTLLRHPLIIRSQFSSVVSCAALEPPTPTLL
jgi:hypothetical protein